MKILAVNAGSSSAKFQLFDMPSEIVLVSATFERIGLDNSFYIMGINKSKVRKEVALPDHKEAFSIFLNELFNNNIINDLDEIEGVGHRIVHGAEKYIKPVLIDNEVIDDIKRFSALAPLHNLAALMGIDAVKSFLPTVKNIGIFDTDFHQSMKDESFIYPVPYEWYTKYGVRRYGFHGISHQYISQRIASILGTGIFKAIICHLGNGASITAVRDGECIETSMGFTPMSGITMGTRCGDIDPSIIEYMLKQTDKSIDDIMVELNEESGLLGISGISNDVRDIEEAIVAGNERAILARDIFVRRIVAFIAFYYCILDGTDVIVFTAGIGENSIPIRKHILNSLAVLGVKIDEEANNVREVEQLISLPSSTIKCYVIPTNEELLIARETYNIIM